MNIGNENTPVDNPDPGRLSRFWRGVSITLIWRGVSITLSIVFFALLNLAYFQVDLKELGMWLAGVLAGGIPLIYGFLGDGQRQKEINWRLLPWFFVGLLFLIIGIVDTRPRLLQEELNDVKLTAARYRDALNRQVVLPFKGGQPWQIHQFLLAPPKVQRVRILGINALGVFHAHRANLKRIIDEGGSVQILLAKGKHGEEDASDAFKARVKAEEEIEGRIANRIQTEWDASIAILADILNQLLETHRIEDLKTKFQIRFHDIDADRSILFVERNEENRRTGKLTLKKYLVMNRYSEVISPKEPGQASLSLLVDDNWIEYTDDDKIFNRIWASADPFSLEQLEKELVNLDGEDQTRDHDPESPYQLNSRALRYHEQRWLDDASDLYREVLQRSDPKRPSPEQEQLAERFLPRVYITKNEPFELKDLIVVIHPSRRLIGYHLVWEDDIDYLIDNDPGDHEIVWIQYDEAEERVEQVWAYWHGKFLQTEQAVKDANRHDGRIAVFVQWGKHGSLLEGWHNIIKIDGDKNDEEYEPLQFSRLSRSTRRARGNHPAKGYYAEQYPSVFVGEKEEFIDFTTEVDLEEWLRKRPMIAVSEFANAVIDQWFLPYNIYPKPDWPEHY